MSQKLNRLVAELERLPGIGERSALRMALHILSMDREDVKSMADAMVDFRYGVLHCERCNNISDSSVCPICSDPTRDRSKICVVEHVKDVISIESTGGYNGLYHVLGGVISPMQGISPSDLKLDLLVDNIEKGGVDEVIMALKSSIEGETTTYFISRKLSPFGVKISTIARGIGFGDDIDYADQITLVHAINNRQRM